MYKKENVSKSATNKDNNKLNICEMSYLKKKRQICTTIFFLNKCNDCV